MLQIHGPKNSKRDDAYKNTKIAEKYGTPTLNLKEIIREFKMSYIRYKIRRFVRQLYITINNGRN